MFKNFILLILIAWSTGETFAQQNAGVAGRFRAAVVKVDITPETPQWLRGYNPRQSTSIHDRLYHKIVVLDDGKKQFYLISTDVVGIPVPEYDRVAEMLRKQMGIDPLNVWWSVTHTHSAPEIATHFKGVVFPSMANRAQLAAQHEPDTAYTALFEKKLINGIKEARGKLAPARFGVGWGFSQANINRRAIDVDGKASLGLNPDGEVDRRIGLIRIDKEDGKPMAIIANYPMHGTVLSGESTVISGDAPGIAAEYVEEKTGAPVLYINGAAGNLAPIYSVYPDPRAGHLKQFRTLLGDKILEAHSKIYATDDKINLVVGSMIVETPRRADVGWSNDIAKYSRTTAAGVHLIRLPIRFLRINSDVAIWSAPLEMFCEISNEIRNHSPFPYTFFFGYTNGSLGYLPDETAWPHGGYETGVSAFTPAAHKDLREAVLGYLKGELRGAVGGR
jgi:neutral ceramidase